MAGYRTYIVLVSGDSINQSGANTGGLADAGRICVLGEDRGVDVSADIDGEIGCGGLRGDSTVVCQYTQLETQKHIKKSSASNPPAPGFQIFAKKYRILGKGDLDLSYTSKLNACKF